MGKMVRILEGSGGKIHMELRENFCSSREFGLETLNSITMTIHLCKLRFECRQEGSENIM